jgi:hypothetical protein
MPFSDALAGVGLGPAKELRDTVIGLEVRRAIAGLELSIAARAHAEAPDDLTDRDARAGAILFEYFGERRHQRERSWR